jgi:hypothetical protein
VTPSPLPAADPVEGLPLIVIATIDNDEAMAPRMKLLEHSHWAIVLVAGHDGSMNKAVRTMMKPGNDTVGHSATAPVAGGRGRKVTTSYG